jgi:hypothetical protein
MPMHGMHRTGHFVFINGVRCIPYRAFDHTQELQSDYVLILISLATLIYYLLFTLWKKLGNTERGLKLFN